MDSQKLSACYPWRTFYPLSDVFSIQTTSDHYNRLSSLFDMSVSQSIKLLLLYSSEFNIPEFNFVRLRYFLAGDRPSQTTYYATSLINNSNILFILKSSIYLTRDCYPTLIFLCSLQNIITKFATILFSCSIIRCKLIVKVHRVLSSSHFYSASSRKTQIR